MENIKLTALVGFFSTILVLPATPAVAYIDVATVTYVVQTVIALLAGIAATAAIYYRKILNAVMALKAKFLKASDAR